MPASSLNENEEPCNNEKSSLISSNANTAANSLLLTQEFNNNNNNINVENLQSNNNSPNSLPFTVCSSNSNSSTTAASEGNNYNYSNPSVGCYYPMVLSPFPQQSEQYLMLFPGHPGFSGFNPATYAPYHHNPPFNPFPMPQAQDPHANKRVKIQLETGFKNNTNTNTNNYNSINNSTSTCTTSNDQLIDQLNSFKSTLKSSFDKNIQKLEVLDRLVHSVTVKGSLQVNNFYEVIQLLREVRGIVKDLIAGQVDFTTEFNSKLFKEFLPLIKGFLRPISLFDGLVQANEKLCKEIEGLRGGAVIKKDFAQLKEKLNLEEQSHFIDLTVLSTKNKDLQKEKTILKETLDKLQLEYSEALKSHGMKFENHKQFVSELSLVLFGHRQNGTEDDDTAETNNYNNRNNSLILQTIDNHINTSRSVKEDLLTLLNHISGIKSSLLEEQMPSLLYESEAEDIKDLLMTIMNRIEQILNEHHQQSCPNLDILSDRIDSLLSNQKRLTHQSLSMKMSLQSQLSDSLLNNNRLRQNYDRQGEEYKVACDQLDEARFKLQEKESRLTHLQKCNEQLEDRIRSLESDLSGKNQENRALNIKIQEMRGEIDELDVKHRHDLSALERKLSILESKNQQVFISKKLEEEHHRVSTILGGPNEESIDLFASSDNPSIEHVEPYNGKKNSSKNSSGITTTAIPLATNSNLNCTFVPSTVPTAIVSSNVQDITVTFTGIRDKQKEFTAALQGLGAVVHTGAEFTEDITHVLAPRGYRSIRVLAASLTAKWIISTDWIESCIRAGKFVSEVSCGGYCNLNIRPFRYRTLWMSHNFSTTHKGHPTYPTAALRTLLEKLGKARWTENSLQADFLLVTEEEKKGKDPKIGMIGSVTAGSKLLTLPELIEMIPIE